MEEKESKQTLYLVMGGRVSDPRSVTFTDPESLHVAGVYSTYENAVEAWRSNAQRTVDDAEPAAGYARPEDAEEPEVGLLCPTGRLCWEAYEDHGLHPTQRAQQQRVLANRHRHALG